MAQHGVMVHLSVVAHPGVVVHLGFVTHPGVVAQHGVGDSRNGGDEHAR